MALQATALEPAPSSSEESGILSDEQIEQLLHEAEVRLKEASESVVQAARAPELQDIISVGNIRKRKPLPKLIDSLKKASYIEQKNGIAQADGQRLLADKHRKLSNGLRAVELDQLVKGTKKKEEKPTSGAEWFDLPKTVLTPQLKRDLQLIEMRSVLDPHRHYKKASGINKVPKFSQVGTVIEGPTEWYSSRINKKDRARNFVEEVMAGEKESGRFKRKYSEIQEKKTSGKKSYYKSLIDKRKKRK
ncbi:hypothetical protein GJ744_000456 [Endocarpon pusillum]|uniref:Fcf2 pre-rRNA processing C-terminal domain-containing protein n=1 Tax=Endocarpon pusillum TaxID=364733 RepID=A0A8H7AAW6_9EURO|nr:hypothetical protein GJ744_000456 [Endocarpon pusillum]